MGVRAITMLYHQSCHRNTSNNTFVTTEVPVRDFLQLDEIVCYAIDCQLQMSNGIFQQYVNYCTLTCT